MVKSSKRKSNNVLTKRAIQVIPIAVVLVLAAAFFVQSFTGEATIAVKPVCGNSIRETGEACDDGNRVTERACRYGVMSCIACRADCKQVLSLVGPYCGDKIRNGAEECDGTQGCGTDCKIATLATCTDSDGGINNETFGTCVSSINGAKPDSCYNSTAVWESYCASGNICLAQMINCRPPGYPEGNRCVDGVCVW